MMNGGVIDLDSAAMLPNFFSDDFKQTMISQDCVFRTQVYELHRLYAVQKNLMTDFEKTSFEEIHMLNQNSDSAMILLSSRNNINGISSSGASSATSLRDFTKGQTERFIPKMRSGISETHQKLFGFQLPADEFISSENVKLPFNFINNRRNHVGDKRKASSFPADVIDSNRESSSFLQIAPKHACLEARDKPGHHHQSLPWFLQAAKEKLNQDNMDHEIIGSRLQAHLSPICQKETQKVSDFSSEEHLQASGRVFDLDLNVAQLDSLSEESANSDVLEASRTSSESATIHKFLVDSHKENGATEKDIQEGTCCKTSYSGGHTGRGRVLDTELENAPESPSDAGKKEVCSSSAGDLRNESVGSSSKDTDNHLRERDDIAIDVAGPEHELQKKASMKLYKKSSVSFESGITADHSGIECGDSNISSSSIEIKKGELLPPEIENVSTDQEQRSSDSTTESNNQLHKDKEELAGDLYELMQGAAAALVGLSLDCRAFDICGLENTDVATSHNEEDDDGRRFSIDSYEAMVLGIQESTPEDLTAMSNKFEVSEPGKECGYKLKRGTRMKDFQKDILPSLCTLARREICEDINTMDGVIRSREYKKMRLKMGDVGNDDRCKPARRRRGRGRVNYSRRYSG